MSLMLEPWVLPVNLHRSRLSVVIDFHAIRGTGRKSVPIVFDRFPSKMLDGRSETFKQGMARVWG